MPVDFVDARLAHVGGRLGTTLSVQANAAASQAVGLAEGSFTITSNADCVVGLGPAGSIAVANATLIPARVPFDFSIGREDSPSLVVLSLSGVSCCWVTRR